MENEEKFDPVSAIYDIAVLLGRNGYLKSEKTCLKVMELLKEQDENLKEYEKLSKTLFKIDKYFRIKDLEFLIDGIENGSIVVLQDDGHFIGSTPIRETTIRIRRL